MKKNSLPGKYEGFAEKKYDGVVKQSLYVPGFDGTKLAVDLVFPDGGDGKPAKGKFPAIVLISRGGRFTDARRHNGADIMEHCVPYGYVGIMPEMRGCGASYGTNDSFSSIENRKDVTAILDWAAAQEWSDGQAVTYGGSNRGLIQFAAAVTRPEPSKMLKGITPVVANADFYYQDYPNGVSALPMKKRTKLSGSGPKSSGMKTKEEILEKVVPVDEDQDGSMAYEAYVTGQYGKNHNFADWLLLESMCRDDGNPNFDGEKTNITIPPITDIDVFKKTDIKVHQFAGLLESGAFGQLMAAKEWGGSIVLGPWDHRQSRTGNPDVPEGMFDFIAEHHKWFDNLLKGVKNGFDQRPPYIYYVMNAPEGERWRCSDTWPLENVKPVTLYLTPDRADSCGSVNDGSLSLIRPEQETQTEYQVDTSIQVFDNGEGGTLDRMHLTWDGDMTPGVDNKGLTFTSAPLFARYCNEIAGCTTADLWVTCSQKDADFIVYLEEVLKNGESRYVSMGTIRASHRTIEKRETWEESGAYYHPCMKADMERCLEEGMDEPVNLKFAIEPITHTFAKGSRLRITVTCANKGAFQHPYDENDLPVISLYQGGDHPSFVQVPFIEHVENVYNGTVEKEGCTGPGTLYFFEKNCYLYFDGAWEKYAADSEQMHYEMRDGKACFEAGFTFRMEGMPKKDGIIQDYQGGEPQVLPLPYKRRQIVDTVPIDAHPFKLFVPMEKTLYVEEFLWDSGTQEKYPAVLYMHGYSSSPSALDVQQKAMLKEGYAVIGIDMRNYPPNCFPDYVYDVKGCIRYVRANAKRLKVNPDRIGCSGQSLGGNATLVAGVSAGVPEMEGTVGGNLEVSSRLQAIDVGYGWSDLLYLGYDLAEEYKDASPEVQSMKYENTDGPTAPAAETIGFTGPGKGLKVLREYMEAGRTGEDPELDLMVERAKKASPVTYIGPDSPPAALYTGLGMVRVDIPHNQSNRTFELYQKYGADCFMFANTNGEYGKKFPIVRGVLGFFDQYLKQEPIFHKCVASPDSCRIVEDACDREKEYAPVIREGEGLYVSADYLREFFGTETDGAGVTELRGRSYVESGNLEQCKIGFRYYADADKAVLVPAWVWENLVPKKRN